VHCRIAAKKRDHGNRQDLVSDRRRFVLNGLTFIYQTLQRLSKFTSNLQQEKTVDKTDPQNKNIAPHAASTYHGQLFNYSDDEEEEEPGGPGTDEADSRAVPVRENEETAAWHLGKLKFRKHIDDDLRSGTRKIGGDGRYTDDYVTVDSRKAGKV
jgi:hypothetical protein